MNPVQSAAPDPGATRPWPAAVTTDPPTRPDLTAVKPLVLKATGTPGSLPYLQGEVRDLLHQRLRATCVLGAGAWPLFTAYCLRDVDPLFNTAVVGPVGLALLLAITVSIGAGGVFLFARRTVSLAGLRLMEFLLYGLGVSTLAWVRYAMLDHALDAAATGRADGSSSVPYATAFNNLPWLSMMVIYGVFIPNTWRRTLQVVGAMALVLVTADAFAWVPHLTEVHRIAPSAVGTVLTLLIGVSVAVFGSFKIGALQEEAHAARVEARALGQYQLKRSLGAGGMGEVYLAEHRLLKRPCAVKLIRPERAGDPQTLARFEREVRATAKLTHPNVVEVYDYGRTEDGTLYYVMEYLDGVSLEDLVTWFGPLPAGRALHVLRQLAGALREAHGEGLVHRDVKPSNVLLCRKGGLCDVAKLLDFGLVQTAAAAGPDRLTLAGGIVGTPAYMAPEQATRPDAVDARSDTYALGGVLHFMLTGRPPFLGETVLDLLMAHRQQAVRPLAETGYAVPAELEAVLRKCLAKDPAERFADAAELDAALRRCDGAVAPWTDEQAAAWWQANAAPLGA
jgi:serine/threonine-protein kinase